MRLTSALHCVETLRFPEANGHDGPDRVDSTHPRTGARLDRPGAVVDETRVAPR
jgi:hypothetical protein